ncbi:MAG: single-stranded DNA-binding protein [Chlorobi bacterium]|nr:single-stranded DNA-binding protein [Chlorobiota bacterium]
MGRIGKDPVVQEVNGKKMVRFRLATSNVQYNPQENRFETVSTDWHTIVVWGERAERLAQTVKKGDLVLVEGQLRSREWEGQDGQKRYAVEVVADTYRKVLSAKGTGQDMAQEVEPPAFEDDAPIDSSLSNNESIDDLPEGNTKDDLPF